MTGIFSDLQRNRRERAASQNAWGVFSYTRKGTVAKTPTVTARDEASALVALERLARLNPTSRFIVREI